MNALSNILHRRQFLFQFSGETAGHPVFADADGFAHILERVLGHQVVLAFAEEKSDGGGVLRLFHESVHGGEIEVQLSGVLRLKCSGFLLNNNIRPKV